MQSKGRLKLMQSKDMEFEYDPEKLINEVKKRPGIWDFVDPDYRAKHVRHQLWSEVVHELMHSDMKVTKSEMRVLEIQLQKKWKSIRDCFQKYIANPNKTKRPYIYSKQLQFLLKNQDMPANTNECSSGSDDDPRSRDRTVWKTKKRLKLSKTEHSSDEDNDNDNDNVEHQEMFMNYNNGDETNEVPVINHSKPEEFAFANVDVSLRNDEDPDKMFLLSLLPHIKSIPEEFRLNVKMEMMQVLNNANYMSTRNNKML
ncbi:uncharacterized protein LOC106143112 [Amyelois transitella]|uniref:uncharacterized protein LOC106143112 n=1 Tax=Amyelois transitella TaxID=680683 RepID=UPI00067AFE1A|nr:uncharacterized protein LOC106143112 [Amyelois transitella]